MRTLRAARTARVAVSCFSCKRGYERGLQRKALLHVRVQISVQLAELLEAAGDDGSIPTRSESAGGGSVFWQIEALNPDLMPEHVTHPGEEKFHERITLLTVTGLNGSLCFGFALLEP